MVAAHFGIPHSLVELPEIEGSGLTGEAAIPQGRDISQLVEELAPTYVPNRNMIMIAHVASRAMNRAAEHLIGGWNRADARNYPDCRNDFLAAVEIALRLGTLVDFRIVRPLIQKDKAAIVKLATELGAPVEFTWTCYLGHDIACGDCDACLIRIGGFKAVGLVDPIEYDREIDWSGCLQIGRSTR
jgi:7-cyano-7-deazaguanine synthase